MSNKVAPLIDESARKREYFPITLKLRDRFHMYAIIQYLNQEFGKTSKFWVCNNRPLKMLSNSNGAPVEVTFRVYTENLKNKEDFNAAEIATFLTLKGGINTGDSA